MAKLVKLQMKAIKSFDEAIKSLQKTREEMSNIALRFSMEEEKEKREKKND